MEYHQELKRLNIKTRNKVRALLTMSARSATKHLNSIRKGASAGELVHIERVLWACSNSTSSTVPVLFPTKPQTKEDFYRLEPISLEDQIKVIEYHAHASNSILSEYINETRILNSHIVNRNFDKAAPIISSLYQRFGYSHHLIRKAVLIRALAPSGTSYTEIDDLLIACGSGKSNIIITSLMHCYQEEQDFLSMKRSIMNLPNRGPANRFTRDISRIPFHPFCSNEEDLRDQLQSAMQSSLLDAVLIAKINAKTVESICFTPTLNKLWSAFEEKSPNVDQIASLYDPAASNAEHLFYKQSSAWLEVSGIAKYRRLLDHFYDAPDSAYVNLTPDLFDEISTWTGAIDLNELAYCRKLTNHHYTQLQALEISGRATRSALVNVCLHTTKGFTSITEESLVDLMGVTEDLNKTIAIDFTSNLAKVCESKLSKLVLYLLIAKRSHNEKDDHLLRKVLQEIAITQFDGDLVRLLDNLHQRSNDIGYYAYEIFTEDFIAKLFQLINSTNQITETRAAIHKWMGKATGEKVYLDRARTLLIDHQINKVRNELDDNRIYVDVARFHEWFDDEILSEMTAALSSLQHKHFDLVNGIDSVLLVLIERCYATFCSNKVFGIASYLGRRIRHGTFKGHLYSGVVSLERTNRFDSLLKNCYVNSIWSEWKSRFEAKIDGIIQDRLHVASPSKRDGLLNPSLNSLVKQDIVQACVRNLCTGFSEAKSSAPAKQIITEYCWRLAEVDLKTFGAFLKHQRSGLVNNELLCAIKASAPLEKTQLASELVREVTRRIDENLIAMQMWFKKPLNVSPKASLPLLYRAVAEEVRQTFPHIRVHTEISAEQDIELIGGAYHVLYDAFYVVVYNAAKHGHSDGLIIPDFRLDREKSSVVISITSDLRDNQSEDEVCEKLKIRSEDDVENAQLYENRSGIPKLYQLQMADDKFSIDEIVCFDRHVRITFSYLLEH